MTPAVGCMLTIKIMKDRLQNNMILAVVFITVQLYPDTLHAKRDNPLAVDKYHMQTLNPAFTETQGSVFLEIPNETKRLNMGLLVFNGQTFIERKTPFIVNFSYALALHSVRELFPGLRAGWENFGVYLNNLENVDTRGNGSMDAFSRFSLNVSPVLYLSSERFGIALSAPKLWQSKRIKDREGIRTTASDPMELYGFTSAIILLNGQ